MFEALDREKCCGCMACADACPMNLIGVQRDKMGFAYPALKDSAACVDCGRCMKVCPNREDKAVDRNVGEVYCAYNRDDERRLRASSGGIFEELARLILDRGGIVYGAAFDRDYLVRHAAVSSVEELGRLRGSKYVQSDTDGVFREVENSLKQGREVLFTGTPCQAAALKKYLGRDYENLLIADLFCYGVPAPAVWNEWLSHVSAGRAPAAVSFRDKTDGWDNYSLRVDFEDGSVYRRNKKKDLFLKTFARGSYIRESCLTCVHKAFPRQSDLTLGDFQELKELFPNQDGAKGVSMIRVNSEKGAQLLKACARNIEMTRVSAGRMDACHPGMGMPAMRHPNREIVRARFGEMPINALLSRYAGMPVSQGIRFAIVKAMKAVKIYEIYRKIKHKN